MRPCAQSLSIPYILRMNIINYITVVMKQQFFQSSCSGIPPLMRLSFRRFWLFLLILIPFLAVSQTAKAYDTSAPSTYGWKIGTYPNWVHLQFEYVFFNYDVPGSSTANAGYEGPVTMTINGEEVKESDGKRP